jgi:hypothetical protein
MLFHAGQGEAQATITLLLSMSNCEEDVINTGSTTQSNQALCGDLVRRPACTSVAEFDFGVWLRLLGGYSLSSSLSLSESTNMGVVVVVVEYREGMTMADGVGMFELIVQSWVQE